MPDGLLKLDSSLAAPARPLLLPGPEPPLPSIEELMQRSLHDLIYFGGKLRPVEEIMMACCAAREGHLRHTMLPAPAQPSSLLRLDSWARFETAILSPALRVAHEQSTGQGLTVVARRAIREGHALVRVPASFALTADGAVQALPKLLDSNLEAHVSLAVWLMRLVDAPPPHLRPWLSALRMDADIDCTLLWSEEELTRLQTSLAHSRARKLQSWAEVQHHAIFAHRESAWRHLRPPMNTSLERFKRDRGWSPFHAARSPAVATRRALRAVGGASWRRVPTCSTTGRRRGLAP